MVVNKDLSQKVAREIKKINPNYQIDQSILIMKVKPINLSSIIIIMKIKINQNQLLLFKNT